MLGGKRERNITNFNWEAGLANRLQVEIGVEDRLPYFIVFALEIIKKLM